MKHYEVFTVDIESLAYGGEGIGRIHDKVVFVPLSAPGDRVAVSVSETKKNYLRGTIEYFETRSQVRTVPLCDHYGVCGGCQWQHLNYDFQLETKRHILQTTIEKIGGITEFELLPTIPSPSIYGYRSRARLQCAVNRSYVIGFFKANTHDVVPIEYCELLPRFLNKIVRQLNEFLQSFEHLIPFNGIEIAAHTDQQEALVCFSAPSFPKEKTISFLRSLKQSIPDVYGIAIHSGGDLNGRREYFGRCWLEYSDRIVPHPNGEPLIITKRVHIDTFTQVNLEQNTRLIQTIYEWLGPSGEETVVDLYCGMGNLSIPLAHSVKRVIGVESNSYAVEDASYNAQRNNVHNCEFYLADAGAGLGHVLAKGTTIDVLIVDPPRKGCREILPQIAQCRPSRIFYVSCNPTTLARDLKLLVEYQYRLRRICPIDMFPQTYHIEAVAELSLG